jgi:hypothetical protein
MFFFMQIIHVDRSKRKQTQRWVMQGNSESNHAYGTN